MREHKKWQKSAVKLLKEIQIHRFSKNFATPVTDKEVTGYSETVRRPMDLASIKKRVENPTENGIRNSIELQRDIMLMFQNALIFNKPDHEVYKEANAMQNDIIDLVEDFIETEKKERESQSPIPPACFPPFNLSTGGKTPSSDTPSTAKPRNRERRTTATVTPSSVSIFM